jgi:succinate dehydrogenase hydrophobic anchor subunit
MQKILLFLLGALYFPLVAHAAAPRTFRELVEYLVSLMNSTIGVLTAAAIVIYFLGITQQMMKSDRIEGSEMRKFLLMGIGIIFVMVSIWGILGILSATFLGTGSNFTGGSQSDAPTPCLDFDGPGCTI